MSVKVHEPVCEDSAQDLYFWFDPFLGDQLKDEWDTTLVGGATAAVVDAQTGGVIRLRTPTNATGDQAEIDWNNFRSLHVDQKVTFEARCKLSDKLYHFIIFGLQFNASNRITFENNETNGSDNNWRIQCLNGGTSTTNDAGVAPDTIYHIFRIECHTHGSNHVHFYIDGVETANSPITTNIPDDAADFLQPWFYCLTRDVNQEDLDIDYVVVRQER